MIRPLPMILVLVLISSSSWAAIFRNSYVSFELPPKWKCLLEETEWVCRSTLTKQSKEAIIILTAKEIGPKDSFRQYKAHLSQPKTNVTSRGTRIRSRVFHAKPVRISNHLWIDGLHLASETPRYYTRYLATIKDKIAILVTFSAHKLHYTRYSNDFFRAIKSLKVTASKRLTNKNKRLGGRLGPGQYGVNLDSDMPTEMTGMDYGDELSEGPSSDNSSLMTWLAISLLTGSGGLFLWRRKKKGTPS